MKAVFAVFVASVILTACGGASAPISTEPSQPIIVATSAPIGPAAPIIGVDPIPQSGVSPLFIAQAVRFIELGGTTVASAQYETLGSFRQQVGGMSAILGLMIEIGQGALPVTARKNAESAIRSWEQAATFWERSPTFVTVKDNHADRRILSGSRATANTPFNDVTSPVLVGYLDTAARSFQEAKRELLELIK